MELLPSPRRAHEIGQVRAPAPGAQVMSLDQAIAAWLDEKHGSSGSDKTYQAYSDTLQSFRALLLDGRLDLDADPSAVFPLAQGWAGTSTSTRRASVAAATFNQRLAIISSFYEYAIRADVLHYNPIERVKRRKIGAKDAAHHLTAHQVKKGLQQIDRSTAEGLRDYALLSIALSTGRRSSELAGLRYKHLQRLGNRCHVTWPRCKGNKQMEDTLEEKTTQALYAYLYRVYGPKLGILSGDAPIWVSFSRQNRGQAIGIRTISNICEEYLDTSKVHTTRHTWAVNMHKQGASLQEIGRGLGHRNLKTTSDYMDEQLGYENPYASKLEDAFGI
jgi:site-specific recombinase XerD